MNEHRTAGYETVPIVESCGDTGWRAGVLLLVDGPRGTRSAKSLGTTVFSSRDAAWQFAESEYGAWTAPSRAIL